MVDASNLVTYIQIHTRIRFRNKLCILAHKASYILACHKNRYPPILPLLDYDRMTPLVLVVVWHTCLVLTAFLRAPGTYNMSDRTIDLLREKPCEH